MVSTSLPRWFSGAGGACHTDRYTVADTEGQKIQHGICRRAAFDKVLFSCSGGLTIRIEAATPTSSSTMGLFEDGNSDVFAQMSQHDGAGVV